jgi:hypothetical protein
MLFYYTYMEGESLTCAGEFDIPRAIAFGKKNLARRLEVAGYVIAAEGRLRKS